MSTRSWIVYPAGSGGGGGGGSGSISTYPTFSAFPVSAANGALGLALDTDNLYAFSTTSNSWVMIAGPSTNYIVNVFTLTSTDILNKYVTLTATPVTPATTVLSVVGGPVQVYGNDYQIIGGNQLNWSGLFLDGVLSSGDILIVQFN